MPRQRLTLEALVAGRTFNPDNWRHRRALDESSPLADPEVEEARRRAQVCRRVGDRADGPLWLREFARLVAESG
jgi:hypothetical protein